eukprot:scaffold4850_cov50-Attheya_sp.AAC.13
MPIRSLGYRREEGSATPYFLNAYNRSQSVSVQMSDLAVVVYAMASCNQAARQHTGFIDDSLPPR